MLEYECWFGQIILFLFGGRRFPQPSNAQRYMCPPCINRTHYNFIVNSLICFRCWEFRSSGEDYKNSPGRSPKLQNSQEFARAAGVGLGECKARTAKQPQGPERKQSSKNSLCSLWLKSEHFTSTWSTWSTWLICLNWPQMSQMQIWL